MRAKINWQRVREDIKNSTKGLESYVYILDKKINARKSGVDDIISSNNEMIIGHDTVTTNYCVRKYLRIAEFPKDVPEQLFSLLRTAAQQIDPKATIHVNFNVKMSPHFIDFDDKNMKLRKHIWTERIKESEETINADGSPMKTKSQSLELANDQWLIESWDYFLEATRNGEATPVAEFYAEIVVFDTSRNGIKTLNDAIDAFLRYSNTFGVKWQVIKSGFWSSLWDFFKYYLPLGSTKDVIMPVDTTQFPVTTRFIANLCDYSQGVLSGKEIPVGIDIINYKVVYKDVGITGQAENILICAGTGGGKSYFNKNFQIALVCNGYTCVIMDRDGEYVDICREMGGQLLSFGSGYYFDTLEIADLTGDDEIDANLYQDALLATRSLFNVLVAKEGFSRMNSAEGRVFSDALHILQTRCNVIPEKKETWVNSKSDDYCIKSLAAIILELCNNPKYIEIYGDKLYNLRDSLYQWFGATGDKRLFFQHKLSAKDIFEAILKGQGFICMNLHIPDNEDKDLCQETVLKLVQASHLTSLILAFNKTRGEFTVVTDEEINRYLQNEVALVMFAAQATGNRKKNGITIFNCNTPMAFIKDDANENLKNIKQNLNHVYLGRFQSGDHVDTAMVAQRFGFANALDVYEEMNTIPEYEHSFMTLNGRTNEVTILKAPRLKEYQHLFETRNSKELIS